MRLEITGWSDDRLQIEEVDEYGGMVVEGFSTEFAVLDAEVSYLAFSDGTLIRCSYDGMWHLVPLERGECKIEHRAGTDLEDDYSDVVHLDCVDGFAWVVCAEKMERLSGKLEV